MLSRLFRRKTPQQKFNAQLNGEIYNRIFPQVTGESDEGLPFVGYDQMKRQTDALELQSLLQSVEQQIDALPDAYGKCFRYAMRKDLHERLRMYAVLAKHETETEIVQPQPVLCAV